MIKFLARRARPVLAVFLAFALSFSASAAVSEDTLQSALSDTAQYMQQTVKSPQVGSIGGEWAVLGLARSGSAVPDSYYQGYYTALEDYVEACGGVLHEKKYTEYSRVILALSALGQDARDVAGYDLTRPLGDYGKVAAQGLNGPVFALLALDSRNYPMPQNSDAAVQATRQMYVDLILSLQLSDGGWNLAEDDGTAAADPDITAMALQALSKYQDQPKVQSAVTAALSRLSALQNSAGGYSSWGTANAESCAQVIVALGELGLSPEDSRFVKNGNTLLDNLLSFYRKGSGFTHTADGSGSNQMATEQAFYALAAAQRARQGSSSLYRMSDAQTIPLGGDTAEAEGLPGKNAAVKAMPITSPGKTFSDISGAHAHKNQSAIESLASRGIIDGMGDGTFAPESTMTRAQFAAIMVRGLGLTPAGNSRFTDVSPSAWYAGYIGTASDCGIISGRGNGIFDPGSTITRQEAAVMTARAAKLCGMDTEMDSAAVRDILAQFGDYTQTSDWARNALAFCYQADILDQTALNIQPKTAVRRCEIAQMLYNLLAEANLL